MSKVLTTNSPEVLDFFKAAGIDMVALKRVEIIFEIASVVHIKAFYEVEIWASNVKSLTTVIKAYELHQIPP